MKKYYDVHCHVFNKYVLNTRLVNVLLPLAATLEDTEDTVDNNKIENALNQIEAALNVAMEDYSEDVFKHLDSVYNGKFIVTPLMFDLTYVDDNEAKFNFGFNLRKELFIELLQLFVTLLKKKVAKNEILTQKFEKLFDKKKGILNRVLEFNEDAINDNNYYLQIADLENLASKYDYVKPFFSLDPRRWYLGKVDLVQKVIHKVKSVDSKFAGIKIYAPAGFSPTDPVLFGTDDDYAGVYSYCQENEIPITIHCSNAGFACMADKVRINGQINDKGVIKAYCNEVYKFHYKFFSLKIMKAIKERARVLNHPKLWKVVLERFPNLKINFGHFGGSSQIMEYTKYDIPFKKLSKLEYLNILKELDIEQRSTVVSCFKKHLNNYEVNQSLLPEEKKKLWNALFYAGTIDNWTKEILEIISNPKYPNAYADLSCFSEGVNINGKYTIKHELEEFKVKVFDSLSDYAKSKILYGTDFFLTIFYGPLMNDYLIDFKHVFGTDFDLIASDNPKRFLKLADRNITIEQ